MQMDIFSWFLRRNVKKTRWYPLSGIPWYVPYPLQSRAALLHTFFRHSGTLYFCSSPQTETTQGRFFPNIFCPHTTCTLYRRIFSLRILVLPQKNRSPRAMCHFPKHISYNPSPCHLNIVAGNCETHPTLLSIVQNQQNFRKHAPATCRW